MSNFTRQVLFLVVIFAAAFAGFWTFKTLVQGQRLTEPEAPLQAEPATPPDITDVLRPSSNPPEQLPHFTLADTTGQRHNIQDWLNNKPLIINFWATWCPPCRDELPLFTQLQTERSDVQVIGVAMNTAEEVRGFAADAGITFNFPNLVTQQEFASISQAVGNPSGSLPYTLAVMPDGQIVYSRLGEMKPEHIEVALQALNP